MSPTESPASDPESPDVPKAPKAEPEVTSFKLRKKSKKITIEDEVGKESSFTVWELSGPMRDKYVTFVTGKTRGLSGGATSMKDVEGIQSHLICMSVVEDATGKYVTPNFVSTWSATAQQGIFKIAQKLSGLGQDAEEEAKND